MKYNHQNFIDEYRDDLYLMTGKKCSISTVYKQIRRLGYSSKKIYIRAAEIDKRERIEFKLRLHRMCPKPEMLVSIDGTNKMSLCGGGRD